MISSQLRESQCSLKREASETENGTVKWYPYNFAQEGKKPDSSSKDKQKLD